MTMTAHHPTTKLNESGIVSIIVTMIIMVILSLIVLGFAQTSRREQRQGLDRQLVSQARYAAESGINDAAAYLRTGAALSPTANSTCNSYTDSGSVYGATLDADRIATVNENAGYTCVLVDATNPDIVYEGVGTDTEVVFPVKLASGGNITQLSVTWSGSDVSPTSVYNNDPVTDTGCPGFDQNINYNFKPSGQYTCSAGVLRIDMVPITAAAPTRGGLANSAIGMILHAQAAQLGAQTASNGQILPGVCNNTNKNCVATFSVSAQPGYYLRIRPIYKPANIKVSANGGADLVGAQAVIDSTGRSADVLKRLLVRIPTCTDDIVCGKRAATGVALQTADSLCKLYEVFTAPTPRIEAGNTDPSCQL